MQCQSPMSRRKFNGSRNVLTLLSVKMTERHMRRWSHWGPPRHYYHSTGSSEKLTPCITNCGWKAGYRLIVTLIVVTSEHPRRIFFFFFFYQRLFISDITNWDFCEAPGGAAHFKSFDKSTQSRYSALALSYSSPFSYGALHFSAPLSAWTLLISSVMAKQYFCMGSKQSGMPPHHIHINLQKAPFYLHRIPHSAPYCILYRNTHRSRTNVLH